MPIPSKVRIPERVQSFLYLLPSLIVTAIFVYGFIAFTFYVSISNWGKVKVDLTPREPLLQTYSSMFAMSRFQADLRNTIVFTVLFMALAILVGLLLAILLDRQIAGRLIFRNVYLFPYALSFVVTGVVWRWIFNPETGLNLIFDISGLNPALTQLGIEPLRPGWITDPAILFQVNKALSAVWPAADRLQVTLGIPAAIIPVVIAATWQLSGFVMAMYIGGMATISHEVREAARIDGATERQVYQYVIIPMLKPVTISVAVILFNMALKIFDLVFTMSGVGPGFATDMPSIFVFEMMFRANRYNVGSAASIVMLILGALVIIPYLKQTLQEQ